MLFPKNITNFFKIFIFSFFLISKLFIFPQNYTISGYIEDTLSGERLIYATVYDTLSKRGSISNVHGFYSLSLSSGYVTLRFSFAGYQPVFFHFFLAKDTIINVKLTGYTLSEVIITTDNPHVENVQMSVIELPVNNIYNLPVFMSERDIMKILQLFPGVQSGNEGTTGLYIRGGASDQNLILLDGVPLYNVDHMFGFFSVFHPDAIQHIQVIKGSIPARYGGRLSSVIDIRMKEGNKKKYSGTINSGIISSSVAIEGPIIKDSASFIFTARRTYLDLFSQLYSKFKNPDASVGYFFYDLNFKTNYILTKKDHIFASFYAGNDKVFTQFKNQYINVKELMKFSLKWGNIITAFRWNRMINSKLFSNLTITYSQFQFLTQHKYLFEENDSEVTNKNEYILKYYSGIFDWAIKADFEYFINHNNKLVFGVTDIYHTFIPGVSSYKFSSEISASSLVELGNKNIYAHEFGFFVEDEINFQNNLLFNLGARYNIFPVQDTFYHSIDPRISFRYLISKKWSVKSSYTNMTQYILLLTNNTIGLPTDLWLPITRRVHPQRSWQVALGIFHLYNSLVEFSLEAYYKNMTNLIEYKEGASFFSISQNWEDKITAGNGKSYGIEFLTKKDIGTTTGWIGYTLSWTTRQFDYLNFGKPFPYKYDRRHNIGIAISHKFSEKINAGIIWVYGSGIAYSLPIETYPSAQFTSYFFYSELHYYGGRNQFRAPAYHRLDASINFQKNKRKSTRIWSFSIYNLYNRKNPFILMFTTDTTGRKHLTQFSLFPIIPSISYSLKF